MLKSKHITWEFLEQLLYIYALLGPGVPASLFCQFDVKCAKNDSSGTSSLNEEHNVNFEETIIFPEAPESVKTLREKRSSSKQQGQSNQCCQDCMCGRNCGHTSESCCFPELANKSVNDSIETCTYAQSPIPHVEERYTVFAYYMVDRSPPDGCLNTEFCIQHPGKECGEIDAAYWGSLYPVSSVSTGKIYRNIHCAKCHGVNDATLWQASIKLGTYLTDELEYDNSRIYFINIEGNLNIIERRCFNGKIFNQCPSSDFFLPATLGMDMQTVASACLNENFSPYIHENVYANVFCLICNINLTNHDNQQSECSTFRAELIPFTAILIPSATTVYQKEQNQLACVSSQYQQLRPKCRPVLCQSGTIFIDGECQLVTEIVNALAFMVNIVLVPTSKISPLLPMDITELSNHLQQIWGPAWWIQKVAVSTDFSSEVETTLITLIKAVDKVSMPEFLSQIKRNINNSSHWTHNSLNESVYLKSLNTLGPKAISRGMIELLLGTYDNSDDSPIKDALNASKTYQTVFSEPLLHRTETISEMLYCEQIELYHNEFVRVGHEIVYIKHLARLLYGGQFIAVPGRDGQGSKLRICLYESEFSSYISSSGARISIVISNILAISVINAAVYFN